MDEPKKSMPAVKAQDSERGFIENFADGVEKIFEKAAHQAVQGDKGNNGEAHAA